jgi:L-lactate dehydrogenase complex protein LldG
MSDREIILARLAAALVDVQEDEPVAWQRTDDADAPAAYIRERKMGLPERVALFVERCAEYRAHVVRCADDPSAIARAVADACTRHGARRLAAPADLDPQRCPPGIVVRRDDPPLALHELDDCDGVLSGAALAIALTGTIALAGGPGQGRRALTLVPDLHVCVVAADDVVAGVPEALEQLGEPIRSGHPITFVSGPSATSDIELSRVEGVHGPRRLEVIVAGGGA